MSCLLSLALAYVAVCYMRSMMIGAGFPRLLANAVSLLGLGVGTMLAVQSGLTAVGSDVSSGSVAGLAGDVAGFALLVPAAAVLWSLALGRSPLWLLVTGAVLIAGALGWKARADRERAGSQITHHGSPSTVQNRVVPMTPQTLRGLTPLGFEQLVAQVLRAHGWTQVKHTGRPGDAGADILAVDPDGVRVLVQCKCYGEANAVTSRDVQNLVGLAGPFHDAERVLVVTTGRYTRHTRDLAARAPQLLTLWDGDILVSLTRMAPAAGELGYAGTGR